MTDRSARLKSLHDRKAGLKSGLRTLHLRTKVKCFLYLEDELGHTYYGGDSSGIAKFDSLIPEHVKQSMTTERDIIEDRVQVSPLKQTGAPHMRSIIPPVPIAMVLNDSFNQETMQDMEIIPVPGTSTGTPVVSAALVANQIIAMQMEYVDPDEQAVDGERNVDKKVEEEDGVKHVEEDAEEKAEGDEVKHVEEDAEEKAEEGGVKHVEEEAEEEDESDVEDIDEEIYSVEKIVKKRIKKGVTEYRVKWLNCPSSDNTWEPENNIFDKDVIRNFENKSQK